MTPLERRYRLLLHAYPKDERRRIEDELVTVLLACAPAGRRVPSLADALNLLAHGLRARVAARRGRVSPALVLPGRSSAPIPETYGQALQTVCLTGFRPTVDDWNWTGMRRSVKRVLIVLLVAGVAIGIVSAVRYLRDETPFGPSGGDYRSFATVRAGNTVWLGAGLTLSGSRSVSVGSITPRIATNTADAKVVVMRCTGGAAEMLAQSGEQFEAQGMCDSLTPWRTQTISPSIPSERGVPVIFKVTPTRPGIVKIEGVNLTLHDGWRSGHQDVGYYWTITSHS